MQTDFMKIPEVAELLKVSKSQAYKLAKEGLIPTKKVGKSIRVPIKEYEEWRGKEIAGA